MIHIWIVWCLLYWTDLGWKRKCLNFNVWNCQWMLLPFFKLYTIHIKTNSWTCAQKSGVWKVKPHRKVKVVLPPSCLSAGHVALSWMGLSMWWTMLLRRLKMTLWNKLRTELLMVQTHSKDMFLLRGVGFCSWGWFILLWVTAVKITDHMKFDDHWHHQGSKMGTAALV